MTFTKYWELNGKFYENIGVNKITAHKIWRDACDAVEGEIKDAIINKYQQHNG